jgi:hypothetical protein
VASVAEIELVHVRDRGLNSQRRRLRRPRELAVSASNCRGCGSATRGRFLCPCYNFGDMAKRKRVNPQGEVEVATKSRRRCCLCFSLSGDMGQKAGQIAHLDQDPSNNNPDNLAWLCIPHHDQYDGRTSQSKNYTMHEVKAYRRMLFQHIEAGGLTTNPSAVPVEERKRQVEVERANFEDAVSSDRFHRFRADAAIMAVSIIPAVLPEPVYFSRSKELVFRQVLQPIGSSEGCPLRHEPKAIVCPASTDHAPSAMTELREDGALFGVLNMMYGRDSVLDLTSMTNDRSRLKFEPDKPFPLWMNTYQPWTVTAVARYLAGLKKLSVCGPWYLGLSILKAKHCQLIPSNDWGWLHDNGPSSPSAYDRMRADTTLIPADAEVSTVDGVEVLLRRPLKHLWSHCNYPRPPSFGRNGEVCWPE